MLDHVLEFKGEVKRVNIEIVNYNLTLIAHNGSGFDSYVVLKSLSQWRKFNILLKNRVGVVSLRIFNGFVDKDEKSSIWAFQTYKTAYQYFLDEHRFWL